MNISVKNEQIHIVIPLNEAKYLSINALIENLIENVALEKSENSLCEKVIEDEKNKLTIKRTGEQPKFNLRDILRRAFNSKGQLTSGDLKSYLSHEGFTPKLIRILGENYETKIQECLYLLAQDKELVRDGNYWIPQKKLSEMFDKKKTKGTLFIPDITKEW